MDIITHSLAGFLVKKFNPQQTKPLRVTICLFIGALIPDIGEIKIQSALAIKFGTALAVYDDRTSDVGIANQISVTWLYDILHSIPFPVFLCLCAGFFLKNTISKNCIYYFSIGLLIHTALDSFTHGKVWALKLFYPLSNHRFKILENAVGNWWDWTPKFKIPLLSFEMPIYCPIIWVIMVVIIFFLQLKTSSMIQYLKTAVEFTKKLNTTGAFSETSKYVVENISKFVDKDKKQIIVEYGAGHGNITRGILAKMNIESVLYAFEIHSDFCKRLEQIDDTRLKIVNLSASDVYKVIDIPKSVDCIISSIPFSFIPDEVLSEILSKSQSLLKENCYMTQVLYSARHLKQYEKYFKNCNTKLVMNIPPANVYECQN